MFVSESIYTNNVYYVDMVEMTIEMWNWSEQRILNTEKVTDKEMAEFMFEVFKHRWVQRSSDEDKVAA